MRVCLGMLVAVALLTLALPVAGGPEGRRIMGGKNLEIYYWPEHDEIAFEVREVTETNLKTLTDALGLDLRATIHVEIVRSQREFNQRAGGEFPLWTLGVAGHHQDHIVLKPLRGADLRRLVIHELTHVLLDMKLRPTRGEAPRWLHEGLAQWMEGEMPAAQKDVLGAAAVAGRLLKLSELEQAFAGKRETVDLAYAQSYALVAFMVEQGPPGALGHYLQYLMDTGDPQLALRRAMGLALPVLEARWLQATRRHYLARGVPLTVDLAVLGLMGGLFILMVRLKLGRAREIRERMQEEERLEELLRGIELPPEAPGDAPGDDLTAARDEE